MKKFTISYIAHHNPEVFQKYLKNSLENLKGDYDVLFCDYTKKATSKYNEFITSCKTPYLIITHQDVTFSPDLLENIEKTIQQVPEFGAIGIVGVDNDKNYRWSVNDNIYELDTLDSCFIVLRIDSNVKFDDALFDEVHLSTEDYCAQLKELDKKIYTIKMPEGSYISHHSSTCNSEGYMWGNYSYYREIFNSKWPGLQTT